MVVLHTCKNEEDLIKNEGARVLTRLYDISSDDQGQLPPKSEGNSAQIRTHPSLNLSLSSFPERMKKIQSKIKELDC